MPEFEIVLDIRPSPNTSELIVTKQRLTSGRDVQLVGQPHEERVSMSAQDSAKPFLDRGKIKIESRAQVTLDGLPGTEATQIIQRLTSLTDRDPSTWRDEEAHRVDKASQLHLARVAPRLQAIIVPDGAGGIQLVDLVRDETLRQFESRRNAGSPK